jgi:glycosyltransferase involved in cell wall biosynthesis
MTSRPRIALEEDTRTVARHPLATDFAVVIPALNEVANIPALFAALAATFERRGLDGEVILVDDGSTDGTHDVAVAHAAACGLRAQVLRHRRNLGKTQALLTGAEAASSTHVVLFDADLQYSADEIPRFLDLLHAGWDIVAGRKVGHYDKRRVSAIYNAVSRRLFRVPARDLNSMKAFRRDILREVPLRHDWHRWLVVLAHARGWSVTELDIELHPRRAGASKYTGSGRIVESVGDLLVVWFYLRFSAKPMKFFGGLGFVLAATGFAIGLAAAVLRTLQVPPPPFGYRPVLTLVVLLMSVGVTLVGFGFVAEMIAILRADVDQLRRRRD